MLAGFKFCSNWDTEYRMFTIDRKQINKAIYCRCTLPQKWLCSIFLYKIVNNWQRHVIVNGFYRSLPQYDQLDRKIQADVCQLSQQKSLHLDIVIKHQSQSYIKN